MSFVYERSAGRAIFSGHLGRVNIVLNTEQIVEKSRWAHKWHPPLGLPQG
jgi:hypothetical protein